jgi:hypothetical protein
MEPNTSSRNASRFLFSAGLTHPSAKGLPFRKSAGKHRLPQQMQNQANRLTCRFGQSGTARLMFFPCGGESYV